MDLSNFQFLRPLWLLLLPLLPALWWLRRRQRGSLSVWQQSVDAHLLPHLLQHGEVSKKSGATLLWLLAGVLAIVAMAGPSWRQQATPLWQLEAPLVIALDLSAAMRATDLPPSRLTQARAKLQTLLAQRKGGQVGLLVYAGDAFAVAPITRDARTVAALVDSLNPDLMPVEGQRSDRAIKRASKMLRDSGASRGQILLVSDRADPPGIAAAQRAAADGFSVSVLAVGTLSGAPLSNAQGFVTGPDGQPQLARLDPASLQALASAGGGRYVVLGTDDQDLSSLGVLDPTGRPGDSAVDDPNAGQSLSRSDDGYWLLLALLPLVLAGFRRGWLTVWTLALGLLVLAPTAPLEAADTPPAPADVAKPAAEANRPGGFWDSLWQRADQRAHTALQQGDLAQARALAQDPDTQGAAAYRSDDYAAAAQAWSSADSADAHYNRGNALAKAGKLEEALKAYDAALERQPGMDDAVANRQAVEDFLRQQQSQQQSSENQSSDQSEQDKQDKSDPSDQQKSEQSGQSGQEQSEQAQSGQEQSEQEKSEQSADESNQGEASEQDDAQDSEDSKAGQEGQTETEAPSEQPADAQSPQDEPADPEEAAKAAQARAAEQAEQAEAQEAAKRAMQQALDEQQPPTEAPPMTAQQRADSEQRQATEQLLRRVPDDPGGLLRRKFQLEYRRRLAEGEDE